MPRSWVPFPGNACTIKCIMCTLNVKLKIYTYILQFLINAKRKKSKKKVRVVCE